MSTKATHQTILLLITFYIHILMVDASLNCASRDQVSYNCAVYGGVTVDYKEGVYCCPNINSGWGSTPYNDENVQTNCQVAYLDVYYPESLSDIVTQRIFITHTATCDFINDGYNMAQLISYNTMLGCRICAQPTPAPSQSPSQSPIPFAVYPDENGYDEITTVSYDGTSTEIGWIKVMSCNEGRRQTFVYNHDYTITDIDALAKTAISFKIVPPGGESNPEYENHAVIAKPYSNPIIALNHNKELSFKVNANGEKIGHTDISNWIGSTVALNRLVASCWRTTTKSFSDFIYQPCNAASLVVIPQHGRCEWDNGDITGQDIEIYFGFSTGTDAIESAIGSISVNEDGIIQQTVGNYDPAVLYCGADEDKPLWAGILSFNQDILSKLNEVKSDTTITQIHEYVQCSEVIYGVVVKTIEVITSAPTKLIDMTNLVLELVKKIPGVSNIVNSVIPVINQFIVDLMEELTPNDVPVSWQELYDSEDKTNVWNPFDKATELGTMLSAVVCNTLIGSDLNTLLESLANSSSVKAILDAFETEINASLTDNNNNLFDTDLKQQLLANNLYQEFAIVPTVGMQICFSKGLTGCITRNQGISMNLKGEYKIFESRSMYAELPSSNVGFSVSGYVHFDFLSDYLDVINDELAMFIGVQAQIPGISHHNSSFARKLTQALDIWQTHSGKLKNIPFMGNGASVTVDFVNGTLVDNSLIFDILTGGANARLSIIMAVKDTNNYKDLMNCNGFRFDLNVGEFSTFGGSIHFGYEYRKEMG
eukprot:44879_1